ncbi:MAG: hypothetical protein ACFFA4_00340 [Promethearchaeota archaeon]
MSLQELGISHKKIKKKYVEYFNFRGEIKDIPSKIEELYQKYNNLAGKSVIAVIDFGVYSEGGKDIDLCFNLSDHKRLNDLEIKYLNESEVLSITHYGTINTVNETLQVIRSYLQDHLVSGTSTLRLVFHKYNNVNLEENQIEIQYQLHKWDNRLEKSIDKVLGKKTRNEIMKDREILFAVNSSAEQRLQWLKDTLIRIDNIADDYKKYEIISRCAHDFSQKRINYMKSIYQKKRDIDDVIEEMNKDYTWYEKLKREGNIIYVSKIPVNPEEYEKAENIEEKKKNYCHCRFINNNLDKGISPTFCYCGTGWYRQQWEGILEKPVRIEILKSLLKGDDFCQVAIHLPLDDN